MTSAMYFRKLPLRHSLSIVALAIMSFLAASPAAACIIRHMTYAEALADTDSTIIGEIVQVLPSVENQLSQNLNFKVRVWQSERGEIKADSLIDLELVLHFARNMHGSIICPLQRGSGIEEHFKIGERYRMLIKKEAATFDLYWSERPQAGAHQEPEDAGT